MRATLANLLPRVLAPLMDSTLFRLPAVQADDGAGVKRLCLTFDDGPCPTSTGRLLNVLERHGAKATFFCIGQHVDRHPELVREILAAGHEVGNHTYSHLDAWAIPRNRLLAELQLGTASLEDATGRPIRWLRPPFGKFTLSMIAWSRQMAQRMVLWDCVAPDFNRAASAQSLESTLNRWVRPGSVVCLHDSPVAARVTPALLNGWIPCLQDAGYQFVALPESLAFGVEGTEPAPASSGRGSSQDRAA